MRNTLPLLKWRTAYREKEFSLTAYVLIHIHNCNITSSNASKTFNYDIKYKIQ